MIVDEARPGQTGSGGVDRGWAALLVTEPSVRTMPEDRPRRHSGESRKGGNPRVVRRDGGSAVEDALDLLEAADQGVDVGASSCRR